LVETGTTREIFSNPAHPYTQSLLSAVPQPNPRVEKNRQIIIYDAASVNYENQKMRRLNDEHFVLE